MPRDRQAHSVKFISRFVNQTEPVYKSFRNISSRDGGRANGGRLRRYIRLTQVVLYERPPRAFCEGMPQSQAYGLGLRLFFFGDDDFEGEAQVVDLSFSGCMARSMEPLMQGKRLKLSLFLPDGHAWPVWS